MSVLLPMETDLNAMTTFELYVDDDRYSIPTLHLIENQSDERALAMAKVVWLDSEHHLGVELRRDGERISGFGSLAPPVCAAAECEQAQGA
jgi:hypothetical protein